MKLIKNETCLNYYKRRLSEGWKEIGRDGFNVILLSPEGVEKSVDLRNDVETLRPNAAGDETNISNQYPDSGYHWEKVDEVTADDSSTYVLTTGFKTYTRDLYNLPASTGSGTINKITVYARCYTYAFIPSIVERTPVLMSDGIYKNIETIKRGDKVISYDLEKKIPVVSKVVKTYHQVEKGYLILNDTLKITSDHLIYSEGEFKRAGDIRIGDLLLDEKGQEVEVFSIEIKEPEVDTYDLGLDLQHNFFTGGYLVHNVTNDVAKIAIKSGSTVYESAEKTLSNYEVWETISQEWATNPADSQSWEWSDIDALQIGVSMIAPAGSSYTRCTQVYVEVDYTPSTTTSTTTSTSTSTTTTTTLAPYEGGLAFGEQNPTQGETAISWQTFSTGTGNTPTVIGDADWGKMELDYTEEGRSRVYDFGTNNERTYILTENRYGSGQKDAKLQIRGSATSFSQNDSEPPTWEDYSGPISRSWRYVQVREDNS